jgi:uncharacterized protein GlcG (DUF336 family)
MGLMSATGAITLEDDMWPATRVIAIAILLIPTMVAAEPRAPQIEKNVSMRMALSIIEGTIERCTNDGHKVSVVVVDRFGNIAASLRGDGTKPHMMEFARLKAYTAVTNPRGMTSLEFKKIAEERSHLKQIPGIVLVGGGIPIKAGNEIIGAVGVSGAPGEELDEACAQAGIAKVASSLNRP